MILRFSKNAEKGYSKLPRNVQAKIDKQLSLLLTNYRHPSLRARKMAGGASFEARIDIHYRFTFRIEEDKILVLTIGPHDEGLGKR